MSIAIKVEKPLSYLPKWGEGTSVVKNKIIVKDEYCH
jgi:hypothetical protein